MKVTQPARALLHVGFQHADRAMIFSMATTALVRLRMDELIHASPEELTLHGLAKLLEELGIPHQRAGLDERGLRRQIAACHLDAIGHGAVTVAYIQPHIHEKV